MNLTTKILESLSRESTDWPKHREALSILIKNYADEFEKLEGMARIAKDKGLRAHEVAFNWMLMERRKSITAIAATLGIEEDGE